MGIGENWMLHQCASHNLYFGMLAIVTSWHVSDQIPHIDKTFPV